MGQLERNAWWETLPGQWPPVIHCFQWCIVGYIEWRYSENWCLLMIQTQLQHGRAIYYIIISWLCRGRWRTHIPFTSTDARTSTPPERESICLRSPTPPSLLLLHSRSLLNLLGPATPRLPRWHGGGGGQRVDSGRQCRKSGQTCQISFFSKSGSGFLSPPPHRHLTAPVIVTHSSCGHVQRFTTSEENCW